MTTSISSRSGNIFLRCKGCGRKAEKGVACARFAKCATAGTSYAFAVDVAPAGAPRRQVMRSGFTGIREARAALHEVLSGAERGVRVERSKLTVGQYLDEWHASIRGRVRGGRG